jgi:hypothetical protein
LPAMPRTHDLNEVTGFLRSKLADAGEIADAAR